MARFKKFPTNGHEGKLVYSDSIVDNIVKLAVEEIPNVQFDDSLMVIYGNPIKVFFEKDGIHVDVTVKIAQVSPAAEATR